MLGSLGGHLPTQDPFDAAGGAAGHARADRTSGQSPSFARVSACAFSTAWSYPIHVAGSVAPIQFKRNSMIMRNTVFALLAVLCVAATSGCAMPHFRGHGGEVYSGGCEKGCCYCDDPRSGACGSGGCPGGCAGDCQGGAAGGCPGGCAGGCQGGAAAGCAEGGCGCSSGRCCAASPIPDCYGTHQMVNAQIGGPAGPPSGQVTYPYYTTRGPRDFFAAHPPSIGPQ